jgi:NADPH:quinone reductase-like Zn-dependent oxidoreductase
MRSCDTEESSRVMGSECSSMAEAAALERGRSRFVQLQCRTMAHFLLQIAKAKGAYVVSTCSPATQEFVSSLGAEATIDYHSVQPSLPAYLTATYPRLRAQLLRLILDTVGFSVNELYAACPAFLKPGGIYLDVAGNAHINNLSSALGAS